MRLSALRNPVLDRELKERLRTRRATIVITVYLAILALILYAIYRAEAGSQPEFFGGPVASQAAVVGRNLFDAMVLVMLTPVLFIVPGLTADALTGERERQTLVPLQVTLLRPRSIVLGKVLASLAFVSLLVIATLPLLGISFVLGGVSVGQVARAVAAVLATGVVLASLAVCCSSIARRTQGAMILAYGTALFLAVGTPVIYGAQNAVSSQRSMNGGFDPPSPTVLLLNPYVATADAVVGGSEGGFDRFNGPSSPLQGLSSAVRELEHRGRDRKVFFEGEEQGFGQAGVMVEGGVIMEGVGPVTTMLGPPPHEDFVDGVLEVPQAIPMPAPAPRGFAEVGPPPVLRAPAGDTGPSIPFWARSAMALGGLALVGLVIATFRIRTPSDRSAS